MLNRTLALFLLSVGFYGAYVFSGRFPVFQENVGQGMYQGEGYTRLLAQEQPNHAPPHRGSGRCDQVC